MRLLWVSLMGVAMAATPVEGGPPAAADRSQAAPAQQAYENVTLKGRVVWLAEAMRRRYGVESDADAAHAVVALQTDDGQLLPIVKDARGRGFHVDPRLHGMEWELLVRRFQGASWIQVIRTNVIRDGKRYEFDYWCDICAIPMYELKPCECCQGPTRFRFREAAADR